MHHVTRGYFGLQDNEHVVHVTGDKDFVVYGSKPFHRKAYMRTLSTT